MQEDLKALVIIKKELEKVRERYKRKAEKERAKINDVYIVVQGEKCNTEKEINEWYQASYISEQQCDKYIENLQKKLSSAGQCGSFTKSERICNMLSNTIINYATEIVEIRCEEEQELKRQERWKIAQQQGCSYTEWLELEEISRQSEEYEKLRG